MGSDCEVHCSSHFTLLQVNVIKQYSFHLIENCDCSVMNWKKEILSIQLDTKNSTPFHFHVAKYYNSKLSTTMGQFE